MSLFNDHRSSSLLSRVKDDVGTLHDNISGLLSHTAHRLPKEARELADSAYDRLSAGRDYAASRLRSLRNSQHYQPSTLELLGGAIGLGLLFAGAYAIYRFNRPKTAEEELEDELHSII